MRKIPQLLSALVLCLGLMGGVASAQSAEISNTGPDSENTIKYDNDYKCEVDNETDFDVDVVNNQDADSGDASVNGNTTGGNASSGNASNSSSTDVNFGVVNGGCAPVATNGGGGNGGGSGAGGSGGGETLGLSTGGRGAVLAAGTSIAALPDTGTTAPAEVVAQITAVASILAMAVKFGLTKSFES